MNKPYKSRVRVVTGSTREHLFIATSDEAEGIVRRGLANPVIGEFTAFIGLIELTVSLGQLRDHLTPRQRPKGRPRPTLGAASSTGDAGRGLGALLGHHRVLHYGPGIRA
jgi:hypothetical protein